MKKIFLTILAVLLVGASLVCFFWPQNKVNWKKYKVVVLESDDWGMAAWTPDTVAYRKLLPIGVYAGPEGKDYSKSTLENTGDLDRLFSLLESFSGADERRPVIQANYIMATPDYDSIEKNLFSEFSYCVFPDFPSRWARPGLRGKTFEGIRRGVWWPEYHGFSHISIPHWMALLRRGDLRALAAFNEQSFVASEFAVPAEYSPLVPDSVRAGHIKDGLLQFEKVFGMKARSTVAPDLVWDSFAENCLCQNGIEVIQSKWEEPIDDYTLPLRVKKLLKRNAQKWLFRERFYPRRNVNFEPAGSPDFASVQGADQAEKLVRECWKKGKPAVIGTHRFNYVSLDSSFAAAGLAQLRELLARLTGKGDAIFLTDIELSQLSRTGISVLPLRSVSGASTGEFLFRNYSGISRRAKVKLLLPAGGAAPGKIRLVNTRTGLIFKVKYEMRQGDEASFQLPAGEWIVGRDL